MSGRSNNGAYFDIKDDKYNSINKDYSYLMTIASLTNNIKYVPNEKIAS